MTKKYVLPDLNNPEAFKVERKTKPPADMITDKFEGQECSDIDCLDIVDDGQGGKKAVFNQTKHDIKTAALASAASIDAGVKVNRADCKARLETAQTNFDSLSATEKDALIKDLLEYCIG